MASTPRSVVIDAMQSVHDETCYDYSCKCHDKNWDSELELYVSQVAIDEGDKMIASIKTDGVTVPDKGEFYVKDGVVREVLESETTGYDEEDSIGYNMWVKRDDDETE